VAATVRVGDHYRGRELRLRRSLCGRAAPFRSELHLNFVLAEHQGSALVFSEDFTACMFLPKSRRLFAQQAAEPRRLVWSNKMRVRFRACCRFVSASLLAGTALPPRGQQAGLRKTGSKATILQSEKPTAHKPCRDDYPADSLCLAADRFLFRSANNPAAPSASRLSVGGSGTGLVCPALTVCLGTVS
jgi:hypothetical protein